MVGKVEQSKSDLSFYSMRSIEKEVQNQLMRVTNASRGFATKLKVDPRHLSARFCRIIPLFHCMSNFSYHLW